MSALTVEAIKEAIAALPENDQQSLAAWLNLQTMDDWDRQMQRDFSPGGKGTQFREQIKREIAQGPLRPIEEGFAKRRGPRS
jgi:hypothetical protein